VRIQTLFRGNQGRSAAVTELESLMEAELEYAVTKAHTLSAPRPKRRQMVEDLESPAAGAEVPLEELPVGLPEEVYQQHLARGEGIDLVHQRCLERAAERVKQLAPGVHQKQDLISHVKRLQDKVSSIKALIEGVVPVVQGVAATTPNLPAPAAVSPLTLSSNGRKISELSIAVFGLTGVGAVSAELMAKAGVRQLYLIGEGSVQKEDVQRWGYQEEQLGIDRCEALQLVLANLAPSVELLLPTAEELPSVVQQVDLVIDCWPDHQHLAALCDEHTKTRAELQLDKRAGCGWYQMHFLGQKPATALELLAADSSLDDVLWDCLQASTASAVAGMLAQNIFKELLSTGAVDASLVFNASSMKVSSHKKPAVVS